MKMSLPYPPSVNALYRTIIKGKRAMPIKSAEYRNYQMRIGAEMLNRQYVPYGPGCTVAVVCHFYRQTRRGDLDNVLKALLDVLAGIAYENDNQVVEIHSYRHDDKSRPRVVVQIEEVIEQPELEVA